jgi:hypothetical protein
MVRSLTTRINLAALSCVLAAVLAYSPAALAEPEAPAPAAPAEAAPVAPPAVAPAPPAQAAPTKPPFHDGVVTCAGSTCHGAVSPSPPAQSSVNQNEYLIWQQKDLHAKAYKSLTNERSKRIAKNLGLKDPTQEKICLDCHADNIPVEQRGKRFQLDDGVGCEACHGGSEYYLGPHASGRNTHQQNIAVGLYPTEDPEKRAKLCLDCHLGTGDKFATHRIMGAGHPRLRFDLDTYTAIQPAHYKVDEDYRKRKQTPSDAQVWAVGQLMAAERFLSLMTNPKYEGVGPWPELSFYDCHGCHRPLTEQRWTPRQLTEALGPGVVSLNDSAFLIVEAIARRLAPGAAGGYRQAIEGLHKASLEDRGALRAAAGRLLEQTQRLRAAVAGHSFTPEDLRATLRGLLATAQAGDYDNYVAAEQFYMAAEAIRASLGAEGGALKPAADGVFASLKSQDRFDPAAFRAALKPLAARLN